MVVIIKTLIVCFVLCSITSFSQSRISTRLTDKSFKFEANKTLFTISVSDSNAFQNKYAGKVVFLRKQDNTNLFLIRMQKQSALDDLKKDPNVLFIDHHQSPKEESEFDYVNWTFNRVSKAHHFFPDLNGANQNISVKEQGFDPNHIDLINRSFTTSVTPSTLSQHATTVTTLIAGGGNSSFRASGVAPQAQFTSSDFSNILPDNISIFNTNHIYLQNHSYGVGIENYYGNEAFGYDQQVYSNPELLHVFSAGNNGKFKPSSGIYMNMEFANLTGNFKQAKNVLVVNAVDTTLTINAFNSKGPTFDGRLKPELTAYGQGGTSEAAALVSGVSSLIQEKHQRIYQKYPDASMVKAILIASADDIGPTGIDYQYGYGSVNAYKALTVLSLNQLFTKSLVSNEQVSFPITIPPSVSEIKIAISWSDAPAIPNTNTVLVNDIDSWLDDGSVVTLPWVLSSYPHIDSLVALPKRKLDHLNNTEYITLNNPAPGSYQLYLKSGILSNTVQKVSVAYWLNEDIPFRWDFPLANERVEGGKKNLLVWEETYHNQTGDLYWQVNNGIWQLIKSGINLNNYFYWDCPDTLAKAKLKMTIGLNEFISDEFLISPLLQMKTAFLCPDSIGLTWNSVENAAGYELYTMGAQYLKKIYDTADTLVILPKSSNQFFSVAPVINGVSGLRSETINNAQQGTFCYLNLFTAERFNSSQVKVLLQLSSWYQVNHITLFKTSHGNKSIFKHLVPGKLLQLDFYDTEIQPGTITYQAEIVLTNGIKIVSDLIEVYIEEKGKAILYPNPITTSSDLTILSEGGGLKFNILDLYGRIILEKELALVVDAIDVINLPAGVYIYHLVSQESVIDTGRFVKY